MRIGIDIDDTITNSTHFIDLYAKKYDNSVKILKDRYLLTERYHWSKEKCDDFWCKYVDSIMNNVTVKENAVYYINKLYDEGNSIYIITARSNDYSLNVKEITKKFIKDIGLKYTEIIFDSTKKEIDCIEKDIDVMIDDSPFHAYDFMGANVPFLLMRNDYNRSMDCPKVSSWKEVYEILTRR